MPATEVHSDDVIAHLGEPVRPSRRCPTCKGRGECDPAPDAHAKLVEFVQSVSLSPNVARHVADDAAGLLVEIGE